MIKFFRQIRFNLMSENKTGKYLKYAIGEIVLVVIGILIALSINNWNQERNLQKKRDNLIASLLEDFEYNSIENQKINEGLKGQLTTMDAYFDLINRENQTISVDSLKTMARDFFLWEPFMPNMTTYNEAESSGNLSLLNNKQLLQEFTKLKTQMEALAMYHQEGIHTFHNGAAWEFRKTVEPGTIYRSTYSGSTAKDIPFIEYQELMQTPLAKNTLQNQNMILGNSYTILERMNTASKTILQLLTEMQSNND